MEARAHEPEPESEDGLVMDLRVAIRLVTRGLAKSVTIAGVADPEGLAAAVGSAATEVSVEIVSPSVIRVTAAVAEPSVTAAVRDVGDHGVLTADERLLEPVRRLVVEHAVPPVAGDVFG
jgi:Ethanolamine utilization protein EutJ (predicted chaperonin)